MTKIDTVTLHIALKNSTDAQSFKFSRRRIPPRTVLQLSTDPFALVSVTFLIVDEELAAEDYLIGLPILQHLGMDSMSLLEQKRDLLDGIDCSAVGDIPAPTRGGSVSRLMLARLNKVDSNGDSYDEQAKQNDHTDNTSTDEVRAINVDRPRVNCCATRNGPDLFLDSTLHDLLDSKQHSDVVTAVDKMVQHTVGNGFPTDMLPQLSTVMNDHIDIFRTKFSSGPSVRIPAGQD